MMRDRTEGKHARKGKSKKEKRLHQLKILLIIFVVVLAAAVITVYRDYQARPGFLEEVWIAERGADHITVEWKKVRNVNKYVVTYDGKTIEVPGKNKGVIVKGLRENTDYEFSVRADSKKRQGFEAITVKGRTKKATHIQAEADQVKFANWPSDLHLSAETAVTILPGDGYTVNDDGKIIFTKSGTVKVKAKTEETAVYGSAEKEIPVNVLDTVNVKASGAKPHIFYKLDQSNCETVMTVKGTSDAKIPQSFTYVDGKYLVIYVTGEIQRIITYGDKRKVYEPESDLGHANGLTLADGRCYSVRGNSRTCTVFDPPNSNFGYFELKRSASGIAYDETNGMFYTSQVGTQTAYDSSFNEVNHFGRIKRKGKSYCQDCGAYGGIMMHLVSGDKFIYTNYIDFYDMLNGKYLGSIECELSELESIIVDDEGFIELLCNDKGLKDRIWKTPVNIKKICD